MKVSLAGIVPLRISRIKRGQNHANNKQAQHYLTELILGKVVDIKGYGMDQHERILGVVFLNGENINLKMVRLGLAAVDKENPFIGLDLEPYRKVEKEARKTKRGMWGFKNSCSPE